MKKPIKKKLDSFDGNLVELEVPPSMHDGIDSPKIEVCKHQNQGENGALGNYCFDCKHLFNNAI